MKVLMINGSPHTAGNTYAALAEVAAALNAEGVETEFFNIGTKPVYGCMACRKCTELHRCVLDDDVCNRIGERMAVCDGLVIGSPVYFAGPSGALCAVLDRLFYSHKAQLKYKPAAAVVVGRRGGLSSAFDRLNKYFTVMNMPVVSSQYWNMVYGAVQGEAALDGEGMQTMRTLGKNMAWMLKNMKAGSVPTPAEEDKLRTNFIR